MEETNLRMGFIGIVIEDRIKTNVETVNRILSEYGDMIQGRIGIPNQQTHAAVIGLIIQGTTDRVGALTGKLGSICGVQVKSALTNEKKQKRKAAHEDIVS